MNVERNTTAIVRSWLREETHENADRVLEAALDLVDITPQKRAWARTWRTAVNNRLVLAAAAAAVVIAAVGITLPNLRPSTTGGGPSATTASAPTTVSSPSARVSPSASPVLLERSLSGAPLAPGRYVVNIGTTVPVFRFNVTLPAGWVLGDSTSSTVQLGPPAGQPGPSIEFFTVYDVYKDPCHPELGYAGGYLGHANAGDVVRELRSLRGFHATAASASRVGVYSARKFVLSNSIDTTKAKCTGGPLLPLFVTDDVPDKPTEPQTRKFSPSTNGGTTQHVWVVDDGMVPLLIICELSGTSDATELQTIQAIFDTIRL